MKLFCTFGAVILLLAFTGCNFLITATPTNPLTTTPTNPYGSDSAVPYPVDKNRSQALLYVADYGYEYGDVVLLDTGNSPKVGDIILYDTRLNKTDFQVFGPSYILAKVTALPGDNLVFGEAYTGITNVLWGTKLYDKVVGLTLTVPENEYFTDKGTGREGIPPTPPQTEYTAGNRFTVKRAAICGIVLEKKTHKDIPQVIY